MPLKLYNTLTRKKEIFKPIHSGEVSIYVCGPTVYDYAHAGHGRNATTFDIIRKYLIYKGFKVKFVSNYTDVDDKIIKRANEEGISCDQLVARVIPEYEKDYLNLGILSPDVKPKATEYIKEEINVIKKLEENGFTYIINGDGVYYDVSKFKEYGKLSHQKIEDLQAGARVEASLEKKNPQDFVLWKFSKKGEPTWVSPWGAGRPGWHIECSAMTTSILGKEFDIHGGGQDLIFPHHEDEIAQSEGANGIQPARYWMHNGFITVDKEKMSKSLGNFFLLKDIFKKFDGLSLRYFYLSKHYRSPIDFSLESIEQAKSSLDRINEFFSRLENYKTDGAGFKVGELISKCTKEFEKAMDDDFETSTALGVLFDFIRSVNTGVDSNKISLKEKKEIIDFIKKIDSVLGILRISEKVPSAVMKLVSERENARISKNWKESDRLRDEISKLGYTVKDTKDGALVGKN